MTGDDLDLEIRRARADDYEAVAAFTERIWTDRGGDYLPRVYHDWLEDEDEPKKTFLATVGGEAVGIIQAVMLSADEAWFQGMRVHPDYRRRGVSRRLNEACFEWARERGATVGRLMVFSWNVEALGAARGIDFEPITEFRWARPEPDADAAADGPIAVSGDPTAAWRYWTDADARDHLRGLALDPTESWALRELTRADLERLAEERAVLAVRGPDGLAGCAFRTREFERGEDGESETWVEYGVGAWDDLAGARTLLAAVARDAAAVGADEARVAIPETPRYVSDVAVTGAGVSEEPHFVLGIDLTADRYAG